MTVRFTPSARAQFLAAVTYIKAQNPLAAAALVARAKNSLRRLTTYPRSGRKIPEFQELAQREVIVRPYRFFYRVEKSTVWIVAVWHGAQIPASPSTGRLTDAQIVEKAEQEERRASFHEVAERRYAHIVSSGKTVPWSDMRSYLEDRLAGKTAKRPVAKKMTR